jgi:hypothetical protein
MPEVGATGIEEEETEKEEEEEKPRCCVTATSNRSLVWCNLFVFAASHSEYN